MLTYNTMLLTPIFTRTSKFAFEISVFGASRIIQFAFNNESIGGHFPLLDSHSRLLHFKKLLFLCILLTHLDDITQDVFDDTSFDETLMSTLDIWETDFLYTRVVSLWSNIE